MTQDELLRMARQVSNTPLDAHSTPDLFGMHQITRFAELVAAKEREACAQICEQFADADSGPDGIFIDYHAHLIRARGE